MKVLLVRHGQAVEPQDAGADALRWLTPRGRATVRGVAETLLSMRVHPGQVITSPLVRAVQTAELLVAPTTDYARPVSVLPALAPEEGTTAQVVSSLELLDPDETVFLVGHEPRIRLLAAHLLGVRTMPAFHTASACLVTWTKRGTASFEWMMDPATRTLRRTLEEST